MKNPFSVVVIADDFTGACDTGVQLAAPGAPCPVFLWEDRHTRETEALRNAVRHGGPLVIDTESRHCAAEEASSRVEAAVRAVVLASPHGSPLFYKKIDSTLRGNIAAEIAATSRAADCGTILVAPAFPGGGRTTRAGQCLVRGVRVHLTQFAKDPRTPVISSSIAEAVGAPQDTANWNPENVGDALSQCADGGYVIANAETDLDLDCIAESALAHSGPCILVGSAGLAAAVARHLDGLRRSEHPADHGLPDSQPERETALGLNEGKMNDGLPRPVLGLVGSTNPVSREQMRRLTKQRRDERHPLVTITTEDANHDIATAVDALSNGTAVIVATPETLVGTNSGGHTTSLAEELAQQLGTIAARALQTVPHLGLFATGGDTAVAVIREAGLREILAHREIAAGMPLLTVGGQAGAPFVTKAGGFGEPEAMIHAFATLSSL